MAVDLACRLHCLAKRFKRLGADMVLDALGIDTRRFGADAERAQEGFHRLMANATLFRDLAAGIGQEHSTIGFPGNESIRAQPCHILAPVGWATPSRAAISTWRVVAVLDQVGDELDIILDQRTATRFAGFG